MASQIAYEGLHTLEIPPRCKGCHLFVNDFFDERDLPLAGRHVIGNPILQIIEIRRLIADLTAPAKGRNRQTVILSTHILPEVEAICDRVILLDRGRKAIDQPIAELLAGGRSLEEVFARVASRDVSLASNRFEADDT